jgi:hypothetical protein
VTEADVNIQDSETNSYDRYTGQPNGIGNDASGNPVFAAVPQVAPNPGLSAIYTNYPEEFDMNFPYVPTNGPVTITVRLKELTSTIYPNRYTTLTTSASALAATKFVDISNPSQNGQIVTLPGGSAFTIQTCFTTNLLTGINNSQAPNFFSIYINGVFQPRALNGDFYTIGGTGCGTGMRLLSYNWNNPVPGSNSIQVVFSNTTATVVSDTKAVIIAQPLQITSVSPTDQLIVWASTSGLNYEVLATTNLAQPFEPVSGIIPSQGTSTFFDDTANDPPVAQKFYEIQVISSQ